MIHDVYRWFIHIRYKFSAYLSSLFGKESVVLLCYMKRPGIRAGVTFIGRMLILVCVFFSWCADWGPKIDVVGFCFLDLASNYEPPESLLKWLEAGQKPIYIGFGSLVSSFPLSFFDFLFGYLKEI